MIADIVKENKKHFKFRVIAKDPNSKARSCLIQTPHGEIQTPVFMPVGTHGAIKALPLFHLDEKMDCPIILSNTYHLHLSPGDELIAKAKGLHHYMGWKKNILTDSGGFQVFSLPDKKITEEGVAFKAQGKNIILTPEKSIQIQHNLGSDIMMAFDECIPYPSEKAYVSQSVERTTRWANRCIQAWKNPSLSLFGIVQGSIYKDMRKKSAEDLLAFDLPGMAIGGVSVGEGFDLMNQMVSQTLEFLPEDKPRYVMGVGTPEDLLALWEQGIDMSDCIIPTKYGRGGTLFTSRGKIRIDHQNYRRDFYPIDSSCSCTVCKLYSRSYIKHLFDSHEILGPILATHHNLHFYLELANKAREAIIRGSFSSFKSAFLKNYNKKS